MRKFIFPKLICLFLTLEASAQSITDQTGQDLFVVRGFKGFSTGIANTSFKVNLARLKRSTITSYYFSSNDRIDEEGTRTPYYHVTDADGWYLEASVRNVNQSLEKFFSIANQPTAEIGAGYAFNSVTNFNDWSQLTKLNRFVKQWELYLGGFVNHSFIKYYDTTTREVTNWASDLTKFLHVGVRLNATTYLRRSLALAFTLTGDYGLPVTNLKSYQSTTPVNFGPGITVIGQPSGKIGGNVAKQTLNVRASIAVPIFLKALFRDVSKISNFKSNAWSYVFIMPHYAPYGAVNGAWNHVLGGTINFLGEGYGGLNSKIIPVAGIGCDFQTDESTSTGWGSGRLFVSGTVNFGSLKNSGKPKESKAGQKGE